MKLSMEDLKEILVAYKATDIQQESNKIVAVLKVDQNEADEDEEEDEEEDEDENEDEDDTFSPFLSLCSYIACRPVKMRILDWIFKPNSYKVELEVAE